MFKSGDKKELARAMALYISYSVIGPLLIFGAIGYVIDKLFETRFFLLFSIFIAYIVSNVLMFKKLKKINHSIAKIDAETPRTQDDSDFEPDSDDLNSSNK